MPVDHSLGVTHQTTQVIKRVGFDWQIRASVILEQLESCFVAGSVIVRNPGQTLLVLAFAART